MTTGHRLGRARWLAEISAVKKSEAGGHHRAALQRLARLRRSLERRVPDSLDTPAHRGLLRSLEAGIESRAGLSAEAARSYLEAASVAFGHAWDAISLLTNSMWAAEVEPAFKAGSPRRRLRTIKLLDADGGRFLKAVGDVLNSQRSQAGLPTILFGGRYPAGVAEPLLQRLRRTEQEVRAVARRRPTKR